MSRKQHGWAGGYDALAHEVLATAVRGTVCILQSLQAVRDLSAGQQAALAELIDLGPLRPLRRSPPDSGLMPEICMKSYEKWSTYIYVGRNPWISAGEIEIRAHILLLKSAVAGVATSMIATIRAIVERYLPLCRTGGDCSQYHDKEPWYDLVLSDLRELPAHREYWRDLPEEKRQLMHAYVETFLTHL